jgi:protein-tyrosine phosphatase
MAMNLSDAPITQQNQHGGSMRAELYTVEFDGLGKLSVMARPRGGDWLTDEVQAWQDACVDVIVSLLMREEQQFLELLDEAPLCQRRGLIYISYPIPDRGVPSTISDAKSIIDALARYITEGKHVAVHCRMGIGRSTMMAAATLVALGETPERAFAMIQEARGCEVPDTPEQLQWVKRFSAGIQTSDQK